MTIHKHTVHIPVRYDECDAYNHVNHANYIRYMVSAAFGAAEMVGHTAEKLAAQNAVWLAREHEIEFLHPLHVNDTAVIDTWVADFRRVRSLRRYDIRNQHGDLAARAATDWVFVHTDTGRPQTVPPEMVQAFRTKNGTSEPAPPRDKFPTPPPHSPRPYTYRQPVEWRDVDPQRHVNNAAYLSYVENAVWAMCADYGWPPERLAARKIGIVARRYRIQYKAPAVMGDALNITTWVSDARRATAVRHYAVRRERDDALVARARALWVWVNLETGRPIRIPADFMADFEDNFYPGE